ncbi:ArsR/SmtB family transcription factor [Pararhodobacter aggregans]|uniref:ArsR/SmtB family transcription factor n=1 Tax=Pararhodobacter aggregans TaxID=404875 RepID=UPI003A8E026C
MFAPAFDGLAGGGECASRPVDDMVEQAQAAAAFLKALAHEGRLLILCYLSSGEKSVTELEQLLGSRQAAVSQQLARLRLEGLVTCRREGKTIYYSLGDPRAARTIGLMYEMFCGQPVEALQPDALRASA